MTLEGRVALVTGGSRGIGRATAIALADDGADVAVNYVSNQGAAREVVEQVEKLGRRASAYQADVGQVEQVESMVTRALSDFGFVDIVVNNAFAGSPFGNVVGMPIEEFERQFRVSALGPARLLQLLVPTMRERGRGDVVMISSVTTKLLNPYQSAYQVAKAAMETLAFCTAREERRNGIRVNIVRPGLIATDAGRGATAVFGSPDLDELDRRSPTGRMGRPEDVANVVRFLVSEGASFVSGQRIDVDAGGDLTTRIDAWADQGVWDMAEAFQRLPETKRT